MHGNIVLADHGLTLTSESLGEVPGAQILLPPATGGDRCDPASPQFAPPRFRPALSTSPLTHSSPYDATLPASTSLLVDREGALPAISLKTTLGPDLETWHPQRDLLGSASDAAEFVVEIESDGVASLRFGDDE